MSTFFTNITSAYEKWNNFIYKYLLFLYNLRGYKKNLYLFLMGSLTALALPPLKLFFLLPFTFATIIRLIDFANSLKETFIIGFWFCFGFFLLSLYWISFALLHDKQFFWLQPIALIGIPLILSLYNSLLFIIYFKLIRFSSAIHKIILFSCLWVLFEYGRYQIFQFPWNFIGYSFTFSLSILQVTSIIGILGLSFIVTLWACSFHLTFLTGDVEEFIHYFKLFLWTNIILLIIFITGSLKLHYFKDKFTNLQIRIVQGNSQINGDVEKEKDKYISLSTSQPFNKIKYIIWPEGGVNKLFLQNKKLQNEVQEFLKNDQLLVAGSIRAEKKKDKYQFFNSIIFFNKQGLTFYYDKNYLVPFGEFIPFKKFIPIKAISSQISDLSRGEGIQTLKLTATAPPFSPLICYEVAFTGGVVSYSQIPPEWILNITNDAWYFKSFGPYQHFEIAKVRAIEEGLPLVRAANSGFSGVFNQNGKTLLKTKLFTEEIIDFVLPKKQGSRTVFSIFGNIPLLIMLLTFILNSLFKLDSIKKLLKKK